MNLSKDIKSMIHLYVILELAIKSVKHDQKLFESFKVKRPYLSFCSQQLDMLKEEFTNISKSLYKKGVTYEKYQRFNQNECLYSFNYRGKIISLKYHGEILKAQVERKISLNIRRSEGGSVTLIKYVKNYSLSKDERKKLMAEILPILEKKSKDEIERALNLIILKGTKNTEASSKREL